MALVLSSGGARGYAHIGAIDALLSRGYVIGSVAGASMGALVGGLYCTGQWAEAREWFFSIGRRDMLSLLDLSLSADYILKGERVMQRLGLVVPDRRIESLPVPFRAVAADLQTHREVVFSRGSLYRAMRASISIPTVFKPVRVGRHLLVDGGVVNPLPLNRAVRHEGDLLVSVNVSAPSEPSVPGLGDEAAASDLFSLNRLASSLLSHEVPGNFVSLMREAFILLVQRLTVSAQKITPPDVAVNLPMNRFGAFQFDRAREISRCGFEAMSAALDRWEAAADRTSDE